MALLTVRLYGDPALRQPAKPVEAVTTEPAVDEDSSTLTAH